MPRTFASTVIDDLAAIRRRGDEIEARIAAATRERPLTTNEMRDLEDAQVRADPIYRALDIGAAPMPLRGEDALGYRVRVAGQLQRYSKDWRNAELHATARVSPTAFGNAENAIYADAEAMSLRPDYAPRGGLRKRETTDAENGRRIINWHGSPRTWMSAFMQPGRAVSGFFTPNRRGGAPERLA